VKLTNRQGELLHTLAAHREGVFGVAFSPDGQMLASSSEDQRAILWDLDRVLHLDPVLAYSCRWISHYLHHNLEVDRRDRHLCDGVQMPPP
jgi:WD40 repeat protein